MCGVYTERRGEVEKKDPNAPNGYCYLARIGDEDGDEVKLLAQCDTIRQVYTIMNMLMANQDRIFPTAEDILRKKIDKLSLLLTKNDLKKEYSGSTGVFFVAAN